MDAGAGMGDGVRSHVHYDASLQAGWVYLASVVNSCSLFRACSRGAVKRGRNVNKCSEQRPFQVK